MTGKAENHAQTIAELGVAGAAGASLTPTFSRLLRLKPASQYQAASVAQKDAAKAVEWASRMLDAATAVVRS